MNEKLSKIINHPATVPISVGVVSFGIGLGLGYILGRRGKYKLHVVPEQAFDHDAMNKFLDEKEAEYGIVRKDKLIDTSAEEISDDVEDKSESEILDVGAGFVAEKIQREMTTDHTPDPELIKRSVFAEEDNDWNYEEELKNRSEDLPYVLHKDEFYAEERDYTQTTLTYYAGDNIMVDEEDSPIYNHGTVVGEMKFGHGSGDPNVFYVRNDKRKAEYEIIHDSGLYSVEVLGLEIEDNQRVKGLKHSDRKLLRDD